MKHYKFALMFGWKIKLIEKVTDYWRDKATAPALNTFLKKSFIFIILFFFPSRFKDFIPDSIGNRTVISASTDGNCIFNAFSIALYGNEDDFSSSLSLCCHSCWQQFTEFKICREILKCLSWLLCSMNQLCFNTLKMLLV